jgi:hypothetical protein
MLENLYEDAQIWRDPIARELLPVLASPTGKTSAGYPYLNRSAFERLRDWVPHILQSGPRVLEAIDRIQARAPEVEDAARVVRQVVRTAAITAPTDLWLLRHVLSCLGRLGLLPRLLDGETLLPEEQDALDPAELRIDLTFLLARGYLVRAGQGYRLAPTTMRSVWPRWRRCHRIVQPT